jgi:hypothetical protein
MLCVREQAVTGVGIISTVCAQLEMWFEMVSYWYSYSSLKWNIRNEFLVVSGEWLYSRLAVCAETTRQWSATGVCDHLSEQGQHWSFTVLSLHAKDTQTQENEGDYDLQMKGEGNSPCYETSSWLWNSQSLLSYCPMPVVEILYCYLFTLC